jgi:hypothetical protein
MPQKSTARQARWSGRVRKISSIALKTRRKIFCAAIAKNRLPRPAVSLYSEILAKIRKE